VKDIVVLRGELRLDGVEEFLDALRGDRETVLSFEEFCYLCKRRAEAALEVGIFAFKFSNAAGELFDPLALRRRLLCERRGSLPCADGACALLGGAA
jgi:hypothetical protein